MNEKDVKIAIEGLRKYKQFYDEVMPMDKAEPWKLIQAIGSFSFSNPEYGCASALIDKLLSNEFIITKSL